MNRIKEHKGLVIAAAVVVVVVVLYQTGILPKLPDAQKLIEDIAQKLGKWTYLLVGGLAFLETGAGVGLVAPGETAVIVGGVVAGQGEISLVLLLGIVWVCAVLGDTTSFFIGRRLGREFLVKHGPRVKITEERLHTVEDYFQRHGGKTILIGRFIGLVRALAPFIAGSSGLEYRRFIPFSIIGCGLWSALYTLLGYLFYRSFDKVAGYAGKATLVFAVTVGIVVGVVFLVRKLRKPEDRAEVVAWLERQGERPLLRPVAKIVRPLWRTAAPRVRFLFDRLTPGGLGLEFTTTLAVSGIGLYVFTLYAVILSGDVVTTPFDREFQDLSKSLYMAGVADVAKVITAFGAFPAALTLVVITSIVLARNGKTTELVTLVAGAIVLYVAVQLSKSGIDRPRPEGGLVKVDGASYPSGHAAYSTLYVAVAVLLARAVPGIASRATLLTVSLVIAAAIGLSRVYLRVHYWSDVAGGWGLGAGVLGGAATIALVVAYIRNNEPEPGMTAMPPPGATS